MGVCGRRAGEGGWGVTQDIADMVRERYALLEQRDKLVSLLREIIGTARYDHLYESRVLMINKKLSKRITDALDDVKP